MMVGYKKIGAVLGVIAIAGLTFGTGVAEAQAPAPDREGFIQYSPILWSFDLRGGVALPTGDLGDMMDSGPTIGAGLAYFLNPRLALRLDGNVDFLGAPDEAGPGAPDMRIWHYHGGFELHVTDPTGGLTLTLDLGAGGSMYWSDRFDDPAQGLTNARFKKTHFGMKGGARVGVNLGPETRSGARVANLFVGASPHVIFGDEERVQPIATRMGVQPFDSAWLFPIEGGLRINIP